MLPLAAVQLNTEFFKYLLVVVTIPFWWPFAKTLWQELNDSLREEGGLLGFELKKDELERANRELGAFESPLVSEPLAQPGAPRRANTAPARAVSETSAPSAPTRSRGFRSDSGNSPRTRGFR